MPKQFTLEDDYDLSAQEYFVVIFGDPSFKERFHAIKGDRDVLITEWIQQSQLAEQRACFFTMIENEGKAELESTKCLETQTTTRTTEEIEVKCSIVPQNPMGSAIFRIDAKWKIKSTGRDNCNVSVLTEVECTKKIWGVTSVVENLLEKQAKASQMKWFELANRRILEYEDELKRARNSPSSSPIMEPQASPSYQQRRKTPQFEKTSSSDLMRFRLSTFKRVVNGTERISQMLSSLDPLKSSAPESSVPSNTIFANDGIPEIIIQDDESKERKASGSDVCLQPGSSLSSSQNLWRYRILVALFFIIFILVWGFYPASEPST